MLKILRGLDLSCGENFNRYYQVVKLINRSDVANFVIESNDQVQRIQFNLKPNARSYEFRSSDFVQLISAQFTKGGEQGFPTYEHSVTIPVSGVKMLIKVLLKELDYSGLFCRNSIHRWYR